MYWSGAERIRDKDKVLIGNICKCQMRLMTAVAGTAEDGDGSDACGDHPVVSACSHALRNINKIKLLFELSIIS